MGTRMMASAESPVHVNMKNAVLRAAETDTLMINQHNGRPVRVLRKKTTETFEGATSGDPMALLGNTLRLYQDGDFDGTLPQCGQVAGRIDEVLPAREIIARTVAEFEQTIGTLSTRYLDR
jgi:enoyl-[acyl-carrier protein] reductase II